MKIISDHSGDHGMITFSFLWETAETSAKLTSRTHSSVNFYLILSHHRVAKSMLTFISMGDNIFFGAFSLVLSA